MQRFIHTYRRWLGTGIVLLLALCAHAQADTTAFIQVVDTNYATVVYPSDIDSARVDSFYRKRKLDIHKCMNPDLYFEVYRWYATCYRWGGDTKAGIDCAGFAKMLYSKIYNRNINRSADGIYPQCRPLHKHEMPVEGDFVFFNIRGKRLSHVGIYLRDGKFAHATVHAGVIISSMDEAYYKKYFYKYGRLKDDEGKK